MHKRAVLNLSICHAFILQLIDQRFNIYLNMCTTNLNLLKDNLRKSMKKLTEFIKI